MESVNMNRNVNQPIEAGPKSHVILCNLYSDFSKKMEKSDLCNSPRRYVVELEYVKKLLSSASKFNLQKEIVLWEQKKAEIIQKLQEFGITIQN